MAEVAPVATGPVEVAPATGVEAVEAAVEAVEAAVAVAVAAEASSLQKQGRRKRLACESLVQSVRLRD